MEDIRKHLLFLVNRFRREHGLSDLHLDERLSAHSKSHSEHRVERFEQMAQDPRYSHTEPHWQGNWGSENVAWGHGHIHEHPYQVAERLFQSWISSPGHRDNILKAKSHVGIDIAHRWHKDHRRLFMTGRFR